MRKLFLIPLILVLVFGLFIGSCEEPAPEPAPAPEPTPEPTPEPEPAPAAPTGTLRATTPAWIETLDPNLQTTFEYAIYEHLIGTDVDGNFIGELATDWSLSEDGLTWTFNIRQGITFHNDEPFTAEDAKFSIERIMREGSMSPWIGEYSATIASMETPDDYTLLIHCNFVNTTFYTAIWGCPMVPKDYIEEVGDEYFNEHPIGTGPWKFVELVPSVSIEFEAVPNHWRLTPEWAHLIVELVPESSTALAKLRNGETDIVSVSSDEALEMQAEGYELRTVGNPTVPTICMLGTWCTDGPLSDVRFRQALSLAINRQEIVDEFFSGLGEVGGVIWTSPTSWGYDPTWIDTYFQYDEAAAIALLEDVGYPDAFENPVVKMYCVPYLPWLADFNAAIASYWEAIGVQAEIETIDMGTMRALMYAEPYPPELAGTVSIWAMPTTRVSVSFIESAHSSTGNWRLLMDPEWDALLESIKTEPDQEQQLELFRETVEYFLDEYVSPGVCYLPTYYAVSDVIGEWTLRYQYDIWGSFAGIKKR